MLVLLAARLDFGRQTAGKVVHQGIEFIEDGDDALLVVERRDRDGQFAGDLTDRNFAVREDGVLQKVRLFSHEDIPVTVGLVVDHSGSMRKKLPEVIAAADERGLAMVYTGMRHFRH